MDRTNNIKSKAFSGIIWKLLERFAAQFVSTVVSVILARILLPEDYSIVAIVSIFFTFCNVFISSGFNAALIQKKDADIIDYSSVLFVSLFISLILYLIMFFVAPFISLIYKKKLLVSVIRVMSTTFFISAYKGVVCARVSSSLQFKNFFLSTIIGTIISAFIGIAMALKGLGPWALVAQNMSNTIIDSLILTITTKIRFKLAVSFKRLKSLFGYGGKIFVASIIATIYDEIRPLIVGIKFSVVDLAYYNKGRSFPALINSSLCNSISAVLFPVMSKFQDSKDEMLAITRRYIGVSSYIIFPVLLGFLAVSDNFIKLVLTEKWIFASPYVKIFCIAFMFNIIQTGNLQVIRASGRSDIFLKLEIIKKAFYSVVIIIFVIFYDSPLLLAMSEIVCAIIATLINTYPTSKIINYKYKYQIFDLLPNLLIAIFMMIVVLLMNNLNISSLILIFIQIIVGVLLYIIISILTKNKNFIYLLKFVNGSVKNEILNKIIHKIIGFVT